MIKFCQLLIICWGCFISVKAQVKELLLSEGWEFKQSDQSNWMPATVPGNVYLDLYKQNKIPNPYFADNHTKLNWVEEKNWEYQCKFKLDSNFLAVHHCDLVLEGLDTYANVSLNGSPLLEANNMFRTWQAEVSTKLKIGMNVLNIRFSSAIQMEQFAAKNLSYQLPEGTRVFSRKAQFQYGWDFAPRFVSCGIWKPVKLRIWNNLQITDCHYQLQSLTDSLANVNIVLHSKSDVNRSFLYELSFADQDKYGASVKKISKRVMVHEGLNCDTISFSINRPRLWWSNGAGAANLYHFKIKLLDGKFKLAETDLNVGIRKLEWMQEHDSIGQSFYFKLNNQKVFVKGANYVPTDVLLKHQAVEEINDFVKQLKAANINMIRLWGGGVYANEALLDACDKYGIMLWQDFAFACAMYPGDTSFFENVKEEVKEQTIHLRNHACLALYCGNNEIDEAWHNWGWQKQFAYSTSDSAKIWQDYQKLFHEIIPQTLSTYDPGAHYWPSSPSIGWGHEESLKLGDSHYWGVWWGMQEFNVYTKKVGRFMSEYGFQSMPSLATCKQFCAEADLSLQSKAMKAHQKHKTGFETIETYMQRDYKVPKDLSKYIYVSQLLQRDGMKTAIEAHRSNQPYCMGTMFWQLNDCWPGISWSALEYDGTPKALFYHLKYLYHPHLLHVSNNQQSIQVSIVSDSIQAFQAKLHICLKNFKSQILWETEQNISLDVLKVGQIKIDKKALPIFDSAAVYLQVELKSDLGTIAKTNYFYTSPQNLKLMPSKIKMQDMGNGLYSLHSDVFAKDVYVFSETQNYIFSDNFFDLEAGQTKYIRLEKCKGIKSTLQLRYMSLVDAF